MIPCYVSFRRIPAGPSQTDRDAHADVVLFPPADQAAKIYEYWHLSQLQQRESFSIASPWLDGEVASVAL